MSCRNGVLFLAAILMIVVVLPGCGKSPEEKAMEKLIEQGTGGKVTVDSARGKIQITDKEGKATITAGAATEVPAGFPTDIPIYPNTKVINTMTAGDILHVTLISEEGVGKIASSYKQKMKAQGWKETTSLAVENTVTMAYAKGNRSATVVVSEAEKGKTGIQLQVSAKK